MREEEGGQTTLDRIRFVGLIAAGLIVALTQLEASAFWLMTSIPFLAFFALLFLPWAPLRSWRFLCWSFAWALDANIGLLVALIFGDRSMPLGIWLGLSFIAGGVSLAMIVLGIPRTDEARRHTP